MLWRSVESTHTVKGGVMSSQGENDAVTEAWTHAVLDALEAADQNTRLEVARILCPLGFEIVQVEGDQRPTTLTSMGRWLCQGDSNSLIFVPGVDRRDL